MPTKETYKGSVVWSCAVCRFVYADRATAEQCEAYCKAHGACSMEIIKKAVKKP